MSLLRPICNYRYTQLQNKSILPGFLVAIHDESLADSNYMMHLQDTYLVITDLFVESNKE